MSTISVWQDLISANTNTVPDEYRRLCKTQEAETGTTMGPREHFEVLALIVMLVDRADLLILHNRNVMCMLPCLRSLFLRLPLLLLLCVGGMCGVVGCGRRASRCSRARRSWAIRRRRRRRCCLQ